MVRSNDKELLTTKWSSINNIVENLLNYCLIHLNFQSCSGHPRKISNEEHDPSKNQIIKFCLIDPNQTYFSETLIQLLNRCAFEYYLEIQLKFVGDILKYKMIHMKLDAKFFKVFLDLANRMVQDEKTVGSED